MAHIDITKYFKPDYNPRWSKEDWKIVNSIRDSLNLPTQQEQLQEIEERRRDDRNRQEDNRLFNISPSDDVEWEKFKEEGNTDTTENKNFVGKSRLALFIINHPKLALISAVIPVATFAIISLIIFGIGAVSVGPTPFDFCGPVQVQTAVDTNSTTSDYSDDIDFGNYLAGAVPGITHDQIVGLLGNVAIESGTEGTQAYQSYFLDSPETRAAKIAESNEWWLNFTQGKSGAAVGLIQWDPASKLINVAIAQNVKWTDKNFQFGQALAYFQGRSQWSKFMVPGQGIAYYATVGMNMEGCQPGAGGCSPAERTASAQRFAGNVFTASTTTATATVNNCLSSDTQFSDKLSAYQDFVTYVTGQDYNTLHAQILAGATRTVAVESLGHKNGVTDGGKNGFISSSSQNAGAQCVEIANGFAEWWLTQGGDPSKSTQQQISVFMNQSGATMADMSQNWDTFKGANGPRFGPNFGTNGVQSMPGLGRDRSAQGMQYFAQSQYMGTYTNEKVAFQGGDTDPQPGDLGWWVGHIYIIGPQLPNGNYEVFQQNPEGPSLGVLSPSRILAFARLP